MGMSIALCQRQFNLVRDSDVSFQAASVDCNQAGDMSVWSGNIRSCPLHVSQAKLHMCVEHTYIYNTYFWLCSTSSNLAA